jgi:transcriptional regulator with XRE-family HTH domain
MRKAHGEVRIDLVAIGRRIRELRGFDMTQTEFARRIHVAQSYLSALERGEKEPGAAVLLAISREFGKSLDWLLTGKAHVEPRKRVAKGSAGQARGSLE